MPINRKLQLPWALHLMVVKSGHVCVNGAHTGPERMDMEVQKKSKV